jgi:hypothetical protein
LRQKEVIKKYPFVRVWRWKGHDGRIIGFLVRWSFVSNIDEDMHMLVGISTVLLSTECN